MTGDLKVISAYPFSLSALEQIREASQRDVLCFTDTDEMQAHLYEAEIVCANNLPVDWRERAPHLRWLQTTGAGVDGLKPTGLLDADSGVLVTTAVGLHATTISEYVFGSMIMFNRSWPQMIRLQDRHIWPQSPGWYKLREQELADQTLGLVGLGHIGRRIAELGKAFGMRVLATKRTLPTDESDPTIDQFYKIEQLHQMLRQCDYVVITVPLTPQTEKLIGEAELRAMQPHAYLVNIARGRVIDEKALIKALQNGRIGGAGLDVFEQEPLPADSPLYTLPNVILTPHISGLSTRYEKRLLALFTDNLRRYRSGEPLRNRYEAARGY